MLPRQRAAQAHYRLHQLCLAVPLHASQRHDLAGAHLEVDAVDGDQIAVIGDGEIIQLQLDLARNGRAFRHRELDGPTDHHRGELLLARLGGRRGADDLAEPHHRHFVGDLQHLFELVADEQDRASRGCERTHDAEESLSLLRRQHRRRLVEDQHLGVAIEGLQDLDSLLHTNRKFLDDRVRIHLEAVLLGQAADFRVGFAAVVEHPGRRRLEPERDVLGRGEHIHQHEMLVDHADPGAHGVARVGDPDQFAVDADLPGVRPQQAKEHVHQRRLAGAVLAEEAVDLALFDGQVHLVIRDELAEALGDVDEFELHRLPVGFTRGTGPVADRPGSVTSLQPYRTRWAIGGRVVR